MPIWILMTLFTFIFEQIINKTRDRIDLDIISLTVVSAHIIRRRGRAQLVSFFFFIFTLLTDSNHYGHNG